MDETMFDLVKRMYVEMQENQKHINDKLLAIENSISKISTQMIENSESTFKELSKIQDSLVEIKYSL